MQWNNRKLTATFTHAVVRECFLLLVPSLPTSKMFVLFSYVQLDDVNDMVDWSLYKASATSRKWMVFGLAFSPRVRVYTCMRGAENVIESLKLPSFKL